jgi:putative spermidine/putrescine transport system ATP-binding protein
VLEGTVERDMTEAREERAALPRRPMSSPDDQNGLAVEFRGVTKRFGDVNAVDGIDLEIRKGEFFSMLGPSGSGKTTCLRMIAGFEQPTDGRILLSGSDQTGTPPFDRDVNTVFQDYALFAHMTVGQNVEYGLMVRSVGKPERRERAAEALRMVRLEGFDDRRPAQLSGGQRQRVALARALVNQPTVLLLDEPLGALDLKLRQQMQVELKAIQQRVNLTFVYVTHDQEEALNMSDRLAVMNGGKIEQVGTPADVYEQPATSFVAGFVGWSNVLEGEAARSVTGEAGAFTIRPEKIRMEEPGYSAGPDEYATKARVRTVVYLGAQTRYIVGLDQDAELVVLEQNTTQSSMEALDMANKEVLLVWKRQFNRPVEGAGGGSGSEDPREEET